MGFRADVEPQRNISLFTDLCEQTNVMNPSSIGQVEQDNIGLFTRAIEDDVAAIPRDVEITDDKPATKCGQLLLATSLEIDRPELLM